MTAPTLQTTLAAIVTDLTAALGALRTLPEGDLAAHTELRAQESELTARVEALGPKSGNIALQRRRDRIDRELAELSAGIEALVGARLDAAAEAITTERADDAQTLITLAEALGLRGAHAARYAALFAQAAPSPTTPFAAAPVADTAPTPPTATLTPEALDALELQVLDATEAYEDLIAARTRTSPALKRAETFALATRAHLLAAQGAPESERAEVLGKLKAAITALRIQAHTKRGAPEYDERNNAYLHANRWLRRLRKGDIGPLEPLPTPEAAPTAA